MVPPRALSKASDTCMLRKMAQVPPHGQEILPTLWCGGVQFRKIRRCSSQGLCERSSALRYPQYLLISQLNFLVDKGSELVRLVLPLFHSAAHFSSSV